VSVVYNENEPYAAQWLRNLIDKGLVVNGNVDDRSIKEIKCDDVRDAAQFHAFAGIGLWSYALRLAGWGDDEEVWTGSCPCQPFSNAGKGRGIKDERHLWPTWFSLIRECNPSVIFGEQVASPAGRAWFDVVSADLEEAGYAVGAATLPAAGVGAPHIRHRIFFGAVRLGDPNRTRLEGWRVRRNSTGQGQPRSSGVADRVGNANGEHARWNTGTGRGAQLALHGENGSGGDLVGASSPVRDPWSNCEWVECRDGKTRPFEPASFPLAHGNPSRVGRLRAYGNAIVPQVAATFITAFAQAIDA